LNGQVESADVFEILLEDRHQAIAKVAEVAMLPVEIEMHVRVSSVGRIPVLRRKFTEHNREEHLKMPLLLKSAFFVCKMNI
jgi:outer membrane lipopolysaccharide assembly protein LptE/RlpB